MQNDVGGSYRPFIDALSVFWPHQLHQKIIIHILISANSGHGCPIAAYTESRYDVDEIVGLVCRLGLELVKSRLCNAGSSFGRCERLELELRRGVLLVVLQLSQQYLISHNVLARGEYRARKKI